MTIVDKKVVRPQRRRPGRGGRPRRALLGGRAGEQEEQEQEEEEEAKLRIDGSSDGSGLGAEEG